jgi:hypothetical protein
MAQEHSFADFGLHSILTVEIPSPGMTVPGWEHPFATLDEHTTLTADQLGR